MELIWKGILLGLGLSVLVGPLVFAIVQASLEYGKKAGLAVAIGIWISDLAFILAVFFGVSYISALVEWEGFELTVGTIGALILMGMGLVLFLSKPPKIQSLESSATSILSVDDDDNPLTIPYRLYITQGFVINTFNPFTVIFWTTVATDTVAKEHFSNLEAFVFYGTIFVMILLTDSIKVYYASKVKAFLKPKNILKMRKISGIALFVFGVILFLRVV